MIEKNINWDNFAIIKVGKDSNTLEKGYIPIKTITNGNIYELKNKIEKLKKCYEETININNKKTYDELRDYKELEQVISVVEDFLLNESEFSNLRSRINLCTAGSGMSIDGKVSKETAYTSTYEGLEAFPKEGYSNRLQIAKDKFVDDKKEYTEFLFRSFDSDEDSKRISFFYEIFGYSNITDEIGINESVDIERKKLFLDLRFNKIYYDAILGIARYIYSDIARRIHFFEYNKSLSGDVVKNESIKAYSNKSVGWRTINFKIDNLYTAILDTNFGYGGSSYFNLTISYKGFKLTPYSEYVYYSFVNKMDILRYTRSCFLYDSEWDNLFDLIVESYNMSQISEEKFVYKYFISELETMISELEKLLYNPEIDREGYYKMKLEKVYLDGSTKQEYIRFKKDQIEFEYFQLEKISGALEYIESINGLQELNCVDLFITRLITLNKSLSDISSKRVKQLTDEKKILEDKRENTRSEKHKNDKIISDMLEPVVNNIKDNKYSIDDLKEYHSLYLDKVYSEYNRKYYTLKFDTIESLGSQSLETLSLGILLKNGSYDIYEHYDNVSDELSQKISSLTSEINKKMDWIKKFESKINIIQSYL